MVYTKTAEPIKIPLGTDSRWRKEPFIIRGQGRTNPFATARGDKSAILAQG